jgi:hypothetical protein
MNSIFVYITIILVCFTITTVESVQPVAKGENIRQIFTKLNKGDEDILTANQFARMINPNGMTAFIFSI